MARIPIEEPVLQTVNGTLTAVVGASVFVYQHGTTTQATVYSAETGPGTLTQPLTTDSAGRIPGWVAAGEYDIAVSSPLGSYTQPWEAVDATATSAAITATPPDTAANASARIVVAHEAPLNVEWPEYGASPGSADNTAAIQAAINALPKLAYSTGNVPNGRIFFPRIGYQCAGQLNLDGVAGAVLEGIGQPGLTGSGIPDQATLIYTAAGTTPFISARSSQAFQMEKLGIAYTSATFTGNLIDFSHATTGPLSGWDTFKPTIRDCQIGGYGQNGARCLILLKQALLARIEDCFFDHAGQAIRCRDVVGDYSNAHIFKGCYFGGDMTAAILNAGEGLLVDACTVEASSTVNRFVNFYTDDFATATNAYALCFRDCWFGDVVTPEVITALNFGANCNYYGVTVDGGFWGGRLVAGETFMKFAASAHGVRVLGAALANLTNGIDMGVQSASNTHQGFVIDGCALDAQTVTNPILNRNGHLGVRINGVSPYSQEHAGFQQLRSELNSGSPALTALAAAGTGATAGLLSGGGTDAAGHIRVTTGTAPTAGDLVTCTFQNPYPANALSGTYPRVVLEPCNAATAGLNSYLDRSASDLTKFVVAAGNAPAASTQYEWFYHVIQ